MGNIQQSSDVIFLLGAGASVGAGVPDTFEFVKKFIKSIKNDEDKRTINKIVEVLMNQKGSDIDVELLLETLTKLDTRDREPLLNFFEINRFILNGYSEKRPIIERLKDFIKGKAIIRSEQQIRYLEPILGFIEEYTPLDIISVNYDTCIEQFCNVYEIQYEDGFDIGWNPEVFDRPNVRIRLYKLHGSVIWYRSDRGGYIKLPIMTDAAGIKLITGEKAESLMLYPMQKFDYAEPLLELLIKVKNIVQNQLCRVLVVVGYSFRDDHIRRIILDAAAKNRELIVILIDPKASQIYHEKLKYYDADLHIPSSLNGRVVCLPYNFERVFPYLKNHYLEKLKVGMGQVSDFRSREYKGEQVVWSKCIKPLIEAEYTEKIQELLESKIIEREIEDNWQLNIELYLKMYLSLIVNKQETEAMKYLEKLKTILYRMLVDKLWVMPSGDQARNYFLVFVFNYQRSDSGSSYVDAASFRSFMIDQYKYIMSRIDMNDINLMWKFEPIRKIISYLEQVMECPISLEEFISLRKKYISDSKQLETRALAWVMTPTNEMQKAFCDEVIDIEKQATKSLL